MYFNSLQLKIKHTSPQDHFKKNKKQRNKKPWVEIYLQSHQDGTAGKNMCHDV